jgi:type II secretory pathway component GspD/PulD (secretin)
MKKRSFFLILIAGSLIGVILSLPPAVESFQDVEQNVSPETILTQSLHGDETLSPYYVTGEALVFLLKNMINFDVPGSTVIFNRKTAQLFIRHTPTGHTSIETILNDLRKNDKRQVEIEARIIKVSSTDIDNIGLDFFGVDLHGVHNGKTVGTDSGFGDGTYNTNIDFPNNQTTGGDNLGGQFAFAALSSKVDIQAFVDALRSHAVVNTLSAPRIVVANNQRSNITLEKAQYYIDSITVNSTGTQTAQDPSVSMAQSGTILDVTPTINANNTISLELHPVFATVDISNTQILDFPTNDQDIQPEVTLPIFSVQEAHTTITIENGGVAVIGGLIEENEEKAHYKIPLLGDIPIIGKYLFSSDNVSSEKSHIIIFVKAKAVDPRDSNLRPVTP